MADATYRFKWRGNFSMSELEANVTPGLVVTEERIGPQNFVDLNVDAGAGAVPASTQADLSDTLDPLGWDFVAVDPDVNDDGAPLQLGAWVAADGVLTDAVPPVPGVRNTHPYLAFSDTGPAPQDVYFDGVAPLTYVPGFPLRIRLWWAAATAVVGDVRWQVGIQRMQPGFNLDAVGGYGTLKAQNQPAPGTLGDLDAFAFLYTQVEADDLNPGNPFRLRVRRQRGQAGDTMVGDAQLFAASLLQ